MNASRSLTALAAAAVAMAAALPARADDRKFTYSEESKTLPQGSWEFEQWATHQSHVDEGQFWKLSLREEIEYGVTDRFNLAAYLNTAVIHARNVPGLEDDTEFEFESVSVEAKYKLTDPTADAVGLLGYAELAFGEERELEIKLVASKEVGAFTFAYNFVFEWAREEAELASSGPEHETEYLIENTLGASYNFSTSWSAGVEALWRTPFEGSLSDREQTGFFIGPNAHYSSKNWWVTVAFLVRANDADDFEKYEVRMILGVNF